MRQFKIGKSITTRTEESLDKYLAEISRIPMISPEQEVELKERVKEINEGHIETADNTDVTKLQYNSAIDVFPLETEGKNVVKKVENKYSDYKCFTI